MPGFSAAGSIFYKSVCDLWCLCAVCAVLWKFDICVCGFGYFCGCFCEIVMVFAVKNHAYAEILECSILHRFGFERGEYGDGYFTVVFFL